MNIDRTAHLDDRAGGLTLAILAHSDPEPLAGSFITGFIASLCCGGSLIFASIGLGAFYSALGLWRFIPQALAAGAITILAINYVFYRRAAKKAGDSSNALWQKMFISTAIGLVVMAGTFILLEWLNHAVVHADRFMVRPEFSHALIKGVPNVELLYVGGAFFALAVLWALPFSGGASATAHDESRVNRTVRIAILGAAAVLIVGVVVDGFEEVFGAPAGGHGAPASRGASAASQHGQAHN
jgi:hypothetical protein